MKKEDVPQNVSSLGKITTEVCYATDASGNYTTQQSRGWEVKIDALNVTWEDIQKKVEAAKQRVLNNEVSPIAFFIERSVMDINILSGYTGFWKWQIKRHLKPAVFKKLSQKKLAKYAEVFNVSVDELKSMDVHEQ
ncbi:hypothetical protein QTN47_11380 [Danxiaibacter flavus]|uniref:HTH cro/C1-type domain-containing protein n=1 Tax=Danxiaibacter flavus TaxID=3049108 RepID=A0ABV3ZE03_9BACT|nr:hypothetical protein QNM32_11385 [Chitinophagaceae bacterium DXS]